MPRVYVKMCQGNILRRSGLDVVRVHTSLAAVYIKVAIQYQGHLHHHSLTHTHFLYQLWREIQGGTMGRDTFIRQLLPLQ